MKKPGGIALIDRSIFLVRTSLLPHLWIYFSSTIPALLYFLYFFNDMSNGPGGNNRIIPSSFILVLLLILMKTGQAVFCLRSYETLMGGTFRKLNIQQLFICASRQTIFACAEMIVMPLALLLTIPFGWCYAFFQTGSMGTLIFEKNLITESITHSKVLPKQNHIMLWVICPQFLLTMVMCYIAVPPLVTLLDTAPNAQILIYIFSGILAFVTLLVNPLGFLLFANFLAAIVFLPYLIHTLTGWESLYSMNGMTALHPGVLLATWALSFLLMDPLVKVSYILRIYDHQAISSGHDIIKRISTPALLFIVIFTLISPLKSYSETRRVDQQVFDKTVSEVLKDPSFSWRGKKRFDLPEVKINTGPLKSMSLHIKSFLKKIESWIVNFFKKEHKRKDKPPFKWNPLSITINPVTVMIFSIIVILFYFTFIVLRRQRHRPIEHNPAMALPVAEEKIHHTISADENPPDQWERMAHEAISMGKLQAGIRYFYLSTLSLLNDKRLLTLKKSRSNREIRRELQKRYPDQLSLNDNVNILIMNFEYTWYGTVPATTQELDNVIKAHLTVKEYVGQYV